MKRAVSTIAIVAALLVLIVGAFASGIMFDRAIPNWMALLGVEVPTSSLDAADREVEQLIDSRALEETSEESKTAGAFRVCSTARAIPTLPISTPKATSTSTSRPTASSMASA